MDQWAALGYGSSILALVNITVRLHEFRDARVSNGKHSTLDTERYEKFLSVAERIILMPDSNISQVPRDLRNDLLASIKTAELNGLDTRGYPGGKEEARRQRNYTLYYSLLRGNPYEALLRDSLQHLVFNLKLLRYLEGSIVLSQIHGLAPKSFQEMKGLHELNKGPEPKSPSPLAVDSSTAQHHTNHSDDTYHNRVSSTSRILNSDPQAASTGVLVARDLDQSDCGDYICICRCHLKGRGNAHGVRNFVFYRCDMPTCERRKYLLAFGIGWYKLRSWWLAMVKFEATLEGKRFSISPTPYAYRLVRSIVGGCVYVREIKKSVKRWLHGGETADFSKHLQPSEELVERYAARIRDIDLPGKGRHENLLPCAWPRQGEQSKILGILLRKGAKRHNTTSFLYFIATLISEGRHLDLLRELIEFSRDLDDIASEAIQKRPAFCNPNLISESITPDPFSLDFFSTCAENHSLGSLDVVQRTEPALYVPNVDYSERIHSCIKADVNFLGQTALHIAIRQPKQLQLLLGQGLDPMIEDHHGRTPLMYAAAYGEVESAKILLCAHAQLRINPTGRDKLRSRNFVDYAILGGHREIIFEAIDQYTQMGGFFQQLALNIADYAVEKYLRGQFQGIDIAKLQPHWFTEQGTDTIRQLLLKGADVNRITLSGDTLLHLIRCSEDAHTILDSMALTLPKGGRIHVQETMIPMNYSNISGETPLMVAVLRGNVSVIDRYLRAGAQVDSRNKSGRTALHYIVRDVVSRGWSFGMYNYEDAFEKSEKIDVLLTQGADPSIGDGCRCACTPNGCTPLTYMMAGRDQFSMYRGNIGPWLLEWFILLIQRSPEARIASSAATLARIQHFESFDKDNLAHVCCMGAKNRRYPSLVSVDEGDAAVSEKERIEQQGKNEGSTMMNDFKTSIRRLEDKRRGGNDPDWMILLALWFEDIDRSNREMLKNYNKKCGHSQEPASPLSLIDSYLKWAGYCVEHFMKNKDPVAITKWHSIRIYWAERLMTLVRSRLTAPIGSVFDEASRVKLCLRGLI